MKNKNFYEKRKYVIGGVTCLIVLILISRLFYLQVIKNEYKNFADDNAFFKKTIYPARGTIYDRKGKMLVFNQPTYDIVYIPREVQPFDTLDFCNILNITKEQLLKKFADIKDRRLNPGYSSYTMQTFMTQLTLAEYGLFMEKLYKFPGFDIQKRALRQYSYPNAAQVLGYVAEVSKTAMEEDSYYSRGDYAGKSGVERSHEINLRGEKGVEILLRDARGRIQGRYENGKHDVKPVSGKDITLGIDIDLQAYGEYLMQGKRGSIVMIEPSTGEILCMVSAPTYDPSLLLGREFGSNFQLLANNPHKPLFNRAIQGTYPPGSTFKTTQGLIFLQEDIIQPSTSYPCYHGYPAGGGRPACHGHPSPLPLEPAIATSCNSYFCYGLSAMLNNRKKYLNILEAFDTWKDHLVDMGFGYRLGVDLPSENRGFIPNSKYYSKNFKTEKWYAQNVISIAIGQGEVLATPLQVANLAATIANRGYYYKPHIVKNIKGASLDTLYTKKRITGIERSYYQNIANGMRMAVTGGTCRGTNIPDVVVCGKTGTAQNSHGKDHSIFMGFAPMDQPKVAIFVFIENAGFGATYAVPIGRLMLQKYLKKEVPPSDKHIEVNMANAHLISPFDNYKNGFRND
ncbi:penicillin-binding protein 2 [Dysgonomonas sp. PH5-45]|uniref:penicillin-binding protein 2 n=1 Tax=unclassified Dysgonomonas TaxID=2630389 RepID=UPI0024770586|nr:MULTISPECIES: penicillin-binding protein 2 [unclassified Dysgonomonas]MDH6355572.1 penicillin-binding protein 2 [Dysgonomonas sp. PH5-45]MDH6388469.1 penicillin-binding protein 2 [Dysgonomonas sp. PH5-37]